MSNNPVPVAHDAVSRFAVKQFYTFSTVLSIRTCLREISIFQHLGSLKWKRVKSRAREIRGITCPAGAEDCHFGVSRAQDHRDHLVVDVAHHSWPKKARDPERSAKGEGTTGFRSRSTKVQPRCHLAEMSKSMDTLYMRATMFNNFGVIYRILTYSNVKSNLVQKYTARTLDAVRAADRDAWTRVDFIK